MNVLIVLAHPEHQSYNGALAETARDVLAAREHAVDLDDLYLEAFDPVERAEHYADRVDAGRFVALAEQRAAGEKGTLAPEVEREIARLRWCDVVIFQFPLWWHAPPAMLKGWFDRVFVSGLLYTSRMRYDRGVFKGKRAIISVTTGAPEASFGPGGRSGDIERLLWPVHYSLHYMGFSVLPPQLTFGVAGHGFRYEGDTEKDERLSAARDRWRQRVTTLANEHPLSFPGWNDWHEDGRAKNRHAGEAGFRFAASDSLQISN